MHTRHGNLFWSSYVTGVLPGEPRTAECKHCVQYQVKEYNHHEHDYPPICMHWGDVRWVYVELQQLRETYSVKAETFANVTVCLHV